MAEPNALEVPAPGDNRVDSGTAPQPGLTSVDPNPPVDEIDGKKVYDPYGAYKKGTTVDEPTLPAAHSTSEGLYDPYGTDPRSKTE